MLVWCVVLFGSDLYFVGLGVVVLFCGGCVWLLDFVDCC